MKNIVKEKNMQNGLTEELLKMSDEEFHELSINMGLSSAVREILHSGIEWEEIAERLDFTTEDQEYVMNGAYAFSVRDMAILKVMLQEMEEQDENADEEDNITLSDNGDVHGVPNELNYGIFSGKDSKTAFEKEQEEIYNDYQKKNNPLTGSEDWNRDIVNFE